MFANLRCYGDYKRSRDKLILFNHRKVLFYAGIVDILHANVVWLELIWTSMDFSFSRSLGILGMKV